MAFLPQPFASNAFATPGYAAQHHGSRALAPIFTTAILLFKTTAFSLFYQNFGIFPKTNTVFSPVFGNAMVAAEKPPKKVLNIDRVQFCPGL